MSKRWVSIAGFILFFVAVFYAGFAFFYSRKQHSETEVSASPRSLINKPFPRSQLIDIHGSKIDDQILRKGRVVVVFVTLECDACLSEVRFLETVLNRRTDVTYYGLVPFGKPPDVQDIAEKKFPFTVFYDESNSFVASMGINRVPIKVYLEDGIIKKGWMGAVRSDKSKASFIEWLDGLP
jgi:thiol-disulfide isomerase/thioredoxin